MKGGHRLNTGQVCRACGVTMVEEAWRAVEWGVDIAKWSIFPDYCPCWKMRLPRKKKETPA